MHRLLALLGALLVISLPARAEITFSFHPDTPFGSMFIAQLTGNITDADYDAMLDQLDLMAQAEVRKMRLHSKGGGLGAAQAIGRLMRELEFDSVIMPSDVCYSACVFVLAAGIDKEVMGEVGIHRPYFARIDPAGVGPALRAVKRASELYLDEMNIPVGLVEDMFNVDPAAMRILNDVELGAYRLNIQDYIVREERTQRNAARHGMTREAYEVFRGDLNYSCSIFRGRPVQMETCVREVAARHGIKL